MSHSSSSTNIGDCEEHHSPPDNANDMTDSNPAFPYYQLRNRTVVKVLTPIPDCLVMKPQVKLENPDVINPDTVLCSQESVSMLQDIYEAPSEGFPELMETCVNSKLDIITISSDEESDSWSVKQDDMGFSKISKSTSEGEEKLVKHGSVISKIIKLREMLSSKKEITVEKLSNLLSKAVVLPPEIEAMKDEGGNCKLSKENVEFLLRTTNTEKVLIETVQALLESLEEDIEKDFMKVACCWKNSVYEMSVEVLNRVVECEPQVREMVGAFLCRMMETVLWNEKDKNLVLESKSMIVTTFCNSIHLSYTVINFIINNLKSLKTIGNQKEETTLEDRVAWTRLTKNSYYLLRILETLLKSFKTKLENEDIEEVLSKSKELKNYNVLDMWKKHWRQSEVQEEKKPQHEYKSVVGKWCEELDDVLVCCVKNSPVSSLIVGRCGTLAKDIMKMCHLEVAKSVETALSVRVVER